MVCDERNTEKLESPESDEKQIRYGQNKTLINLDWVKQGWTGPNRVKIEPNWTEPDEPIRSESDLLKRTGSHLDRTEPIWFSFEPNQNRWTNRTKLNRIGLDWTEFTRVEPDWFKTEFKRVEPSLAERVQSSQLGLNSLVQQAEQGDGGDGKQWWPQQRDQSGSNGQAMECKRNFSGRRIGDQVSWPCMQNSTTTLARIMRHRGPHQTRLKW